jgi:hypothetical protein
MGQIRDNEEDYVSYACTEQNDENWYPYFAVLFYGGPWEDNFQAIMKEERLKAEIRVGRMNRNFRR